MSPVTEIVTLESCFIPTCKLCVYSLQGVSLDLDKYRSGAGAPITDQHGNVVTRREANFVKNTFGGEILEFNVHMHSFRSRKPVISN